MLERYFQTTKIRHRRSLLKAKAIVGHVGGSGVEHLLLAQGVILGSRDRVPPRAPCEEPASPSAYVSASLCASLMNK